MDTNETTAYEMQTTSYYLMVNTYKQTMWLLFFQAWFTNWVPEWLWMRGATTLNNALRRQAEQRKAPQSLIKRDSSEFDISKFS